MRICLITSAHRPNDDRIFYKVARSLRKMYPDIWIVSPKPEFLPKNPSGVKFSTFSAPVRNRLSRLRNLRLLYERALKLHADVYQCNEPESLYVGIKLKEKLGCKLVYDSHEMHSASFSQLFPGPLRRTASKLFMAVSSAMVRRCDYAFGASWHIAQHLAQTLPTERVTPLLNCPDPGIFGPAVPRHWDDETIVCHDGWLTFDRGLREMLQALVLLKNHKRLRLRVIGALPSEESKWAAAFIQAKGLSEKVQISGWLHYDKVPLFLRVCHIGLSAYQRTPNNIVTSANKEFNYLYFGIPLIAPKFRLQIRKIVEAHNCGVLVDTGNPKSIAEALDYMIQNREHTLEMARNALIASRKQYLWDHQEQRLFRAYEKMLGAKGTVLPAASANAPPRLRGVRTALGTL